ncbi:hypothetical protein EVAR_77619_1 [Eumeta japonica]|uniref:Uncharacterized protein n=1 Tax=Eumeta variegata TaxID=151549 RepID=A0A4C1T6V1_EUMVA|nr:hypothetical protein EVAR_77619_1 [Eumeta japonica]
MRRGSRTQPAVCRTPLGWILHGTHTKSLGRRVYYIHHVAENNIEETVRRYFHIDSLGVQSRQPHSDPEKRALKILKENITERPSEGYNEILKCYISY